MLKYIIQIVFRATRVQMKGKFVVNETRMLQLFRSICPLCGSVMSMEKITNGVLITLKQQCLQCEYKNQWKSQMDASVPAAEDQGTPAGDETVPSEQVSSETQEVGFKHSDRQHILILSIICRRQQGPSRTSDISASLE